MRAFLLGVIILVGWLQPANAEMIFTTSQQIAGTIIKGSTAKFDIFLTENSGGVDLGGVDFTIALSNQSGLAGEFSAGTAIANFAGGATATGGFFPNSFPDVTADFSNSITGVLRINATPTLIATFDLDTSGLNVIPGSYSLTLTPRPLGVIDSGNNQVPLSAASYSTSFAIAAVPEPSSLVLIGLIGGAYAVRRRFTKRSQLRIMD